MPNAQKWRVNNDNDDIFRQDDNSTCKNWYQYRSWIRSDEGLTPETIASLSLDPCQPVWYQILVFYFPINAAPKFLSKLTFHSFVYKDTYSLGSHLTSHRPCWCTEQYKHQEFQFPLLDAAQCGTESEHQVSNGSLIGLFSFFTLSPFTRILELSTK